MGHLMEIKNLQTQFISEGKTVRAVDGVSMYLDEGEIISVVGESGSGKSVTQMSVMQLIQKPGRIVGGEILLNGRDLLKLKDSELQKIRGKEISMVFQEPMTSLNPVFTIGYQISETCMRHLGMNKQQARKKSIEMLKMVGIPDAETRFSYYPDQFSGGMRQRIMIAMMLAAQPKILIADEATTALDVTTQAEILNMLKDIVKKTNTALIIVTHNLGIVARYAERIYVMYAGRILEGGACKELFKAPTHPYTRGLLKAIPRLDDPKDRILVPIDGMPPNLAEKTGKCDFAPRCMYRCDRCTQEDFPQARAITEHHFYACHLTPAELSEKEALLNKRERKRVDKKEIEDTIILNVDHVSKVFDVTRGMMKRKIGQVKALEDITFQVRKGETLGIVGESGCGKTTLARCILKLYEPDGGKITFKDQDFSELSKRELQKARSGISMIFQDPFGTLDPRFTVGNEIGEPLLIYKKTKGKKEYEERVDELMNLVGINPKLKYRMPHEFSGGQRQRIGVAKALASDPELIICDEPVSALDVSIQAQIINLLEGLQNRLGLTYLFIAHDLAVVKHISDRIMVMYLGRVVEIAECDDLYNDHLHPYTEALLSAIPEVDPEVEEKREQIFLKGEIPGVMKRPSGCGFYDRCPFATERCKTEKPQLVEARPNHFVSCFKYTDIKVSGKN